MSGSSRITPISRPSFLPTRWRYVPCHAQTSNASTARCGNAKASRATSRFSSGHCRHTHPSPRSLIPSDQRIKQAVQNPCSPPRIVNGSVARQGHSVGIQLACRLLEALCANDARGELLDIEERDGELRKTVSLQIQIELPQVVMAPGRQDDLLQRR